MYGFMLVEKMIRAAVFSVWESRSDNGAVIFRYNEVSGFIQVIRKNNLDHVHITARDLKFLSFTSLRI